MNSIFHCLRFTNQLWLSLWVLFFLSGPLILNAQVNTSKDLRFGTYLNISGTGSYSKFRDFGVSPLTYRGVMYGGMGELAFDRSRWDVAVGGGGLVGTLSEKSLFTTQATAYAIYYNTQGLYRFWQKKDQAFDLRGGLQFNGWVNIRETPNFNNASTALEALNTLSGALKFNWRMAREQKGRKLLWIFPTKPGIRLIKLSSQVSLPLVHTAWRPKYAYIDDFTNGKTNFLERNDFKLGGYRFQWRNDLSYYLFNGNIFKISYQWDAQRTGNVFNRLEIGHHLLSVGYSIRMN
jgi:hypothetical protein